MSLLTRKRTILAKLETSYGVDASPTGSSNAILVKSLNLTPISAELVSRDLIRPYLGNSDTLLGSTSVTLDFEVELAGSGAAGTAPAWGPLLEACGFAKTVTASTSVAYQPISASFPSMSFYINIDGVLHSVTGARGSFELSLASKQIPTLKFTFTGLYNSPSDTAAPSVSFTAWQQPKVANTANTTPFSLFSYSGILESVSLNLSNDVQYRSLIGDESVLIIDRKPAGTMVIEAPTMAAKDFFTLAKNGTTGAFALTHGTLAGNKVKVEAPRVSIGNPSYQDSQGVQMLSIPFTLVPNSGNDELVITCL